MASSRSSDLSFTVESGEICALIGPNGAGKTTLFNCVSRLYQPSSGSIRFDDLDLLALPAHRIAQRRHRAHVPEPRAVPGADGRRQRDGRRALARWLDPDARADASSCSIGSGLPTSPTHPAVGLPYGTLKRVEIARALAARPQLLLLDEPAAGLTHSEVDELADLVRVASRRVRPEVLLVEHHMAMVMAISDKVVVLDFGSQDRGRRARRVREDPAVIEAYLGSARAGPPCSRSAASCTGGYGAVRVLHGLDFAVEEGEVVVILGANGAGKTTTLRALSGVIDAQGTVAVRRRDVAGRGRPSGSPRPGWRTCRRDAARSPISPSTRTSGSARTRGATARSTPTSSVGTACSRG